LREGENMIATSDTWKQISYDKRHRTVVSFYVDGLYIPAGRIAASPTITSAFYTDTFCVGKCASSCLEITYLPTVLPTKAAKVQVYCTIYPRDGDWLLADETDDYIVDDKGQPIMLGSFDSICVGTWYIDTRSHNTNGWVTLECYDKIAVLDSYTVKQAAEKLNVTLSYPLYPSDIMSLASEITGVAHTPSDISDDVSFTEADINKMPLRTCVGYCAAQAGGNIRMDNTGDKIVFVPLNNIWAIYDDLDYDIYIEDDSSEPIECEDDDLLFEDESNSHIFIDHRNVFGLQYLGLYESIQKVRVLGPDDKTYKASFGSGHTLSVSWPLSSASANIAVNVLSSVEGLAYFGWAAEQALLNPCLQIGDPVVVDGALTIISEITATLGGAYVVSCGARCEKEVTHELIV